MPAIRSVYDREEKKIGAKLAVLAELLVNFSPRRNTTRNTWRRTRVGTAIFHSSIIPWVNSDIKVAENSNQ